MMSHQAFPNINLRSFLPQICQYNVTQLALTDSDPAAQQQINAPRSKYCDKTGLTLGIQVHSHTSEQQRYASDIAQF